MGEGGRDGRGWEGVRMGGSRGWDKPDPAESYDWP